MTYQPGLANVASFHQVAGLDITYAMRFGFQTETQALIKLHQYRYERVDMPEILRRESEAWLKNGNHLRVDDLEWGRDGSLPS